MMKSALHMFYDKGNAFNTLTRQKNSSNDHIKLQEW